MSSANFTIHTPGIGTLSYMISSPLLGGEFSAFSAANAVHNFSNFHSTRYPSLLGGQRRYGMRGFAQHLYTWINFSDLCELVNLQLRPKAPPGDKTKQYGWVVLCPLLGFKFCRWLWGACISHFSHFKPIRSDYKPYSITTRNPLFILTVLL